MADKEESSTFGCRGCLGSICLAILIVFFLSFILIGPMGPDPAMISAGHWTQQARNIGLALYSYANDHMSPDYGIVAYPDGASSTEIFEKLIDGKYVTDPSVFYVPMPGKIAPVTGQKLKPENVSFDMTAGASESDSDYLPLIFMTGYRVKYAPGAEVTPVSQPYPHYEPTRRYFPLCWIIQPIWDPTIFPGLAVYYKGNRAAWVSAYKRSNQEPVIMNRDVPPGYDGSIHDFISPTFDAKERRFDN